MGSNKTISKLNLKPTQKEYLSSRESSSEKPSTSKTGQHVAYPKLPGQLLVKLVTRYAFDAPGVLRVAKTLESEV